MFSSLEIGVGTLQSISLLLGYPPLIFDVSLPLPSFSVSLMISYSSIENSSHDSLLRRGSGEDELRQYSSIEYGESVDKQYSLIENCESVDRQYSFIEEDESGDKQYSSIEIGEPSLMA